MRIQKNRVIPPAPVILSMMPTIERLGELLNENPNGLMLYRDEISGFLKTIDRDDRSNDRAFYLECFNGLGRYTYDRIGRGTIDIESLCLGDSGQHSAGGIAALPEPSHLRVQRATMA